MRSAKIVGLGKYVPPKVLTNKDLEKMVDTSDEWITTRTGIKERHIVEAGMATSHLAYEASKVALKRAGIKAKELDLIIVATITPDNFFPSTACYLQNYLGAKNTAALDISAACSGFVYGIAIAWQFIKGGLYKNILVVGAEVLSCVTDWQDRSTCILFGDGAGAAVLTPTSKKGIMDVFLGSDGSRQDLLILPGGGSRMPASIDTVKKKQHYIRMRGNKLFKIAVKIMVEAAQKVLDRTGLTIDDIDWFIPHQANNRIIQAVAKRLNISPDSVFINIHKYGNVSAASTAIALCELWEEGNLKNKDIVMLDVFGGGLTWGSCVMQWEE